MTQVKCLCLMLGIGVIIGFLFCPPTAFAPLGGPGYYILQEEGSDLPTRIKINMIGTAMTCADDASNLRTNCTLQDGYILTSGSNDDEIPIWIDDGTPAWERRTFASGDFVVGGSNVSLDSSVTQSGEKIGDGNEIYNAASPTVDSAGKAAINNTDGTWEFWETGTPAKQVLDPKRESFIACTGQVTAIDNTSIYDPMFGYQTFTSEPNFPYNRAALLPVAIACDEMTVCFLSGLTTADEDVEVTALKSTAGGSFNSTTLTCTVEGDPTGATYCSGTNNRYGCKVSLGTPQAFAQYDRVVLELDCIGGNCPTASEARQICFRCWTTQ